MIPPRLAAALGCCLASAAGAAELPDAVRRAGVLHASVNAIYAPMEYKDAATGRLAGLDVELGAALAKRLGLEVELSESAFEQLIPSLKTGRADLLISGLTDTPAREETMDFIDYLKTGPQFYVAAASPAGSPIDVCGLKVGTSRSTSFPAEISAWSKANCEAAGRPAITVVPAESTVDARGQLKQGRIDAAVQGSETIPYAMSLEPGVYRTLGDPFATGYQGIAFRKDETALRDAVADALRGLMADGTYRAILATYKLDGNAVDAVTIDGARP
ncbi:ABC transporter substrate-binding protein [Lichenibacterium minor]|uniref:ABC transporter substrate-binding protein n=1 Tax=Lichenibacterium minor TaxID=2316528 RepID=A0A4Q2U166_9HYPH|nr:ABC transporter substrate-binding protein [Lichenibacterium minor]RYC29820.1 ABC transporter substrate-binding protein [Lichenibacterium minor]